MTPQEILQDVYSRHERITLFVSGGKDSTALLLLCEPYWDRTDVVFVDTGDQFPEILKFVKKIQGLVPYFFAMHGERKNFAKYNGWPVEVVPERSTPLGQFIYGAKTPRFCARFHCCQHNMWEPMAAWIKYSGATCVLRGDRESERMMGMKECEGVEYAYPLYDLDVKEVRQIIRNSEHGLWDNRFDYDSGSSLDCMHCFGYFDNIKWKLDFAKWNHPQLYRDLKEGIAAYKEVINEQMEKLNVDSD